MTVAEYRTKWGLPASSPFAPNYAAKRSEMAQKIGLGQKRSQPAAAREVQAAPEVQKVAKGVSGKQAKRSPKAA